MKTRKLDLDRMRQLIAKGLNASQIAGRLGVKPEAIHHACKRLSIAVASAPGGKVEILVASRA